MNPQDTDWNIFYSHILFEKKISELKQWQYLPNININNTFWIMVFRYSKSTLPILVVHIPTGKNKYLATKLNSLQVSDPWSRCSSPVSVVLSGWKSLTPPGRDTNLSQVSFQQMLVLITDLRRKRGKLSELLQRRSHKCSTLDRAKDQTGDLVAGRQRSYQLRQPFPH